MGLGGIISGALGAKGAKKAAAAMREALGQARDAYNAGYNDITGMYNAYLPQAQQGYNNYVNTINGDTGAFSASPWGQAYNDYVMNNTINRLQGTAAAKGSLQSGNTLKELQENIQAINNNDYLNRLNQYLGYTGNLGNTGLGITSTLAGYRDQLANNIANNYMQLGGINAGQQVQKYNNLGNMWGGLADTLQLGLSGYYMPGNSGGLGGAYRSMATGGLSLLPSYGK